MQYRIHEDGRFDIIGRKICLYGCFPMADETPLHPFKVIVEENTVTYQLNDKKAVLSFEKDNGRIGIRSELTGFFGLHDFEPAGCPVIKGADHVFVQGLGMEGPSGTFRIDENSCTSHGITALYHSEDCMMAYAEDHTRYSLSFTIRQEKLLFEDRYIFCGAYNLEGTAGDFELLPVLYFEEGQNVAHSLRMAAQRIAEKMKARHKMPPCMFWCSWYYAYETLDMDTLRECLDGIKAYDDKGFQYVELDAGYVPSLGDWLLSNHRYPGGLKEAASVIRESGYAPGIWIGPFMVGDNSALYKEHPDWMLKGIDQKPVIRLRSYTEPKLWGNRDGNYYVLDTSHPDALEYIRKVFSAFREWGFRFFKTDFMLWSMYDTSRVSRYDSSLTSVEIMRRTLGVIREAIGDDSYLLGCIAPFMPFIGYADGMRIAGDGGAQWDEPFGPVNLLSELPDDNYFNHIYWQNDTDSILIRDFDTFLSEREVESLTLMQAFSGGLISTSDPIHKISEGRRRMLSFIKPDGMKRTPQLPYFAEDRKELLMTHHLPQGNMLYVLNPLPDDMTVYYDLKDLFGSSDLYLYRYSSSDESDRDEVISIKSDHFTCHLGAHESALVFITERPLDKKPVNLWNW